MRSRALVLSALAVCAVSLSGCENGMCEGNNNPALQLLGALLGCTENDVFDESPPKAAFTINPETPRVGQPVTLDASSSDPGGLTADFLTGLIGIEWDTDGDNVTDAGGFTAAVFDFVNAHSNPYGRIVWTPTKSGPVRIGLRVTTASGRLDTELRTVNVLPAGGPEPPPPPPPGENTPPTVTLTASPNPVPAGTPVTFTATATDDGSIATYDWDLMADGSFEGEAGHASTATRTYTPPAPPGPVAQRAIVRVTDDRGATATAEVTLSLCSIEGCFGHRATVAAAKTTSATVLGKLSGRVRDGRVEGRAKTTFQIAGRIPREGAKPSVPSVVRKLLGGRFTLAMTGGRKGGKLKGRALITTGRGGPTACASVSITPVRGKQAMTGTLKLLGGTGSAARLRLTVRFAGDAPGFAARIFGSLRATTGAAKRAPPRVCLPLKR